MMAMASPPASRRLPVWRTVLACYAAVFSNFGELLRIAWLLLLIMVPMYALAYWLSWPGSTGTGGEGVRFVGQLLSWLPNLVELPFLASIAVAWHRLLLRQERFGGKAYYRFDAPVWRYAGLSLGLLVAASMPFLYNPSSEPTPIEVGIVLGVSLGMLTMIFLAFPRLSIALPAIALGERLALAQAWRLSRGNSWRLCWATALCSLPILGFLVPLYWYFDWQSRGSSVVLGTLTSLTNALFVMVGVTLLSFVYRFFVLHADDALAPSA